MDKLLEHGELGAIFLTIMLSFSLLSWVMKTIVGRAIKSFDLWDSIVVDVQHTIRAEVVAARMRHQEVIHKLDRKEVSGV